MGILEIGIYTGILFNEPSRVKKSIMVKRYAKISYCYFKLGVSKFDKFNYALQNVLSLNLLTTVIALLEKI